MIVPVEEPEHLVCRVSRDVRSVQLCSGVWLLYSRSSPPVCEAVD